MPTATAVLYVPVVRVTVEPVQNAERPGIEKTHRRAHCPPYAVALYKSKWGRQAIVTRSELVEGDDSLWRVPTQAGMSPCDSEMARLRAEFPKVFDRVYTEDAFAEAFDKVAVDHNPREDARQARIEEAASMGSEIAAQALVKAAGSQAAAAIRKRPALTKKVPKKDASADE